jgi:hypothetical protein
VFVPVPELPTICPSALIDVALLFWSPGSAPRSVNFPFAYKKACAVARLLSADHEAEVIQRSNAGEYVERHFIEKADAAIPRRNEWRVIPTGYLVAGRIEDRCA